MLSSAQEVTRAVPAVPGGRLMGYAVEFRRDPLGLFQRAREYGDVVRLRFGPVPVYLLNSPGAIRQALVSQAGKLDKGISFGRVKRLISDGLVLSDGDLHQRQRRLLQSAFHSTRMAPYAGIMREVAVPRINAWQDGATLALDREMRSITLTVVTRALLSGDVGTEVTGEMERLWHVLLAGLMPSGVMAQVPFLGRIPSRSNLRFNRAGRRLGAILADIIEQYRAADGDHGDLMSILLHARDDETGTGMTGSQLREEATTLVIAGSETTGNTLAWACYLLTQHPEVQERVQREADLVLAGEDADSSPAAHRCASCAASSRPATQPDPPLPRPGRQRPRHRRAARPPLARHRADPGRGPQPPHGPQAHNLDRHRP